MCFIDASVYPPSDTERTMKTQENTVKHEEKPVVATKSGRLAGVRDGATGQIRFLGIPYAEPPVGNLRFRPTVPVRPWDGVRDASRFGPAGTQVFDPSEGSYAEFTDTPVKRDWVGSEDNLTLNVWTPALDGRKRPVVVWVHGGANWLESSRLATYHGDRLVARGDVVFVSLNYRLGIFGWVDMSVLGGPEYAGSHSHGLRDQATALRWIRENIEAFGGDAANITVMGESAGSIDLSWLLTNGHLDGIAKRVVLMSGIAGLIGLSGDLGHGFTEEFARAEAKKFLDMCGFDSMDRLLAMSTEEIMDRYTAVAKSVDTLFVMDSQFWPRHVQGFAPLDPFRAAAEGGSRGIDVMIGFTTYEMGLWLTWDETLDTHPPEWSAEKMPYLDEARRADICRLYRENFAHDPEGTHGMHMIGDSIFVMPSLWFADTLAQKGENVWMFQFDWRTDERRRALHAGDQTFLFGSLDTPAGHHLCGAPKDEADAAARQGLMHAMQDAIIAYARQGDPNAHENPDLPAWPRYDTAHRAMMSFDLTSRVVEDPAKPRRAWWYENIYAPALTDGKA